MLFCYTLRQKLNKIKFNKSQIFNKIGVFLKVVLF